MSTTFVVTGLGQTAAPIRRASSFFERYWSMLREWQKRDRLRTTLYNLSDRELQDIGTTLGEVEHVARLRSGDPRRVRPA